MRHGQPHWIRENTEEFELPEDGNSQEMDLDKRSDDDVDCQPKIGEVSKDDDSLKDACIGILDIDLCHFQSQMPGSDSELLRLTQTHSESNATLDPHYFLRELDTNIKNEEAKSLEEDHYNRLTKIPESPTMSFTEEEHFRVKRLLKIDQESRIALKDSVMSLGDSVLKQVQKISFISTLPRDS
jgi:hypothetical protein